MKRSEAEAEDELTDQFELTSEAPPSGPRVQQQQHEHDEEEQDQEDHELEMDIEMEMEKEMERELEEEKKQQASKKRKAPGSVSTSTSTSTSTSISSSTSTSTSTSSSPSVSRRSSSRAKRCCRLCSSVVTTKWHSASEVSCYDAQNERQTQMVRYASSAHTGSSNANASASASSSSRSSAENGDEQPVQVCDKCTTEMVERHTQQKETENKNKNKRSKLSLSLAVETSLLELPQVKVGRNEQGQIEFCIQNSTQ